MRDRLKGLFSCKAHETHGGQTRANVNAWQSVVDPVHTAVADL